MRMWFLLFATMMCACVVDAGSVRQPSPVDSEDAGVDFRVETLQAAFPYTKINSDACQPLDWGSSTCLFRSGATDWACAQRKAIRAFAMSVHPNGGCRVWTTESGDVAAIMKRVSNPSEQLYLTVCGVKPGSNGNTRRCDFGDKTNGGTTRWGFVDVTASGAYFRYNDGGIGEPNYPGNVFWYSAP